MVSITVIGAKNNERVKRVCKLMSSSSFRLSQGQFAIEGLRLCDDAVKSEKRFSELYVTEKFALEHSAEFSLFKSNCDNLYFVTQDVMKKMSDTVSPQGVIGITDISDFAGNLNSKGRYLALVNVQDPSNVGAAARTAEALGVDGLLVCGGCDIYNPKALRSSMGAFFRIGVKCYNNTDLLFSDLSSTGIVSFASTPRKTAEPINKVDFISGCAVLIGNEANGLDDDTIERCNRIITIPMKGRAESLNASAAAAIICYCMTAGGDAD